MKKLLNLPVAVLLMAAAILVGCKGKDSVPDDPKAVVSAFFERISKKDFDGAAKLATKDSKGTLDLMKKTIDAAEKMKGVLKDANKEEEDPTEDFRNMEVGDAKINGDSAVVSIRNKKKNETIEFPLVKEGGNWKVDFSMGTLMKMGMNQASKEGDNPFDGGDSTGLNEGMDQMMNADSLKKGMEMVDSMMKQIDPEKMKEMMKGINNN